MAADSGELDGEADCGERLRDGHLWTIGMSGMNCSIARFLADLAVTLPTRRTIALLLRYGF